jgi:hypothetical protein
MRSLFRLSALVCALAGLIAAAPAAAQAADPFFSE